MFDDAGEAVPLTLDMLHADPRDLHVLPGYERDDRTLDKYAERSRLVQTYKSLGLSCKIENCSCYVLYRILKVLSNGHLQYLQ